LAAKKTSGEEQPKKATPAAAKRPATAKGKDAAAKKPDSSGPTRKPAAQRPKVTHEMIAMRAYLISQSEESGSEEENWLTAERELRGK
jgi:hypothetical protein